MNTIAWRAWDFLGGLAIPKLVTRETAVLLTLAASLLVFRTLRERCLMVWIVGWIAYFVSHHALVSASGQASLYAVPVAQGEFILAVALFVAVGLLLLHLIRSPISSRLPTESGTLFDMLLGLGMLLVVFDESRLHTRRLATLNALTTSIAGTGHNGAMATTALK